jgi:hypothetical protein
MMPAPNATSGVTERVSLWARVDIAPTSPMELAGLIWSWDDRQVRDFARAASVLLCEQSVDSHDATTDTQLLSVSRWVSMANNSAAMVDDSATCSGQLVDVGAAYVGVEITPTFCSLSDIIASPNASCVCERKKDCFWSDEFDDQGLRRTNYLSLFASLNENRSADTFVWTSSNGDPFTFALAMDVVENWRWVTNVLLFAQFNRNISAFHINNHAHRHTSSFRLFFWHAPLSKL